MPVRYLGFFRQFVFFCRVETPFGFTFFFLELNDLMT